MTSSINKKPRHSILENHIQAQIIHLKNRIPTYTDPDNPIRIWMEKQIPILEKELERITIDNLGKMRVGYKTPQ